MSMGYFIIIRGPLGIGKSTVSRKISELLNAKYISIDTILEEHGLDKVSETEGCIPTKNFIAANEYVLPKAIEQLNQGKNILFDGNFYHKEQIDHLLSNLSNYSSYVFTLKAPLEVCIQRDRQRKDSYGEGAAIAVHNLVSRFDYGTIIDMTKPFDKCVQDILTYLPKQ